MKIWSLSLCFTALLCAPVPLMAQCQLCAKDPKVATPTSGPEIPLTIEVEAALDFSRMALISAQSSGRVTIDPSTGMRRVTGGLTDLGGGMLRGEARVHGAPLRPVRISLPDRITLTDARGNSIEVVNLSTNLPPGPSLGTDGNLSFSFGGQLNVTSGGAGNYHGRIPIAVEYQ